MKKETKISKKTKTDYEKPVLTCRGKLTDVVSSFSPRPIGKEEQP